MATLRMKPERPENRIVTIGDQECFEGDVRALKRTRPMLHFWGGNDEPERAAIVQLTEIKPQSIHVTNGGEAVYFISSRLCRPKAEPDHYLGDKIAPSPYQVRNQIHMVNDKSFHFSPLTDT